MQNTITLYEKAVQILTSQGKFYINLGLERVKSLLELYNNPQDKIKCIHVSGTNGKGSTCAMLSSVLKESGYKTGLYTSPHLVDYTERVKINGEDISKEDFADLIFDVIKTAEQNNIHATEFEILTVLAFIYYQRESVDFAIIETGLGGRFDATNVIKNPLLSIITTIDLDHTDRLGDTTEKIAFEKAGIIKPNAPVITLKNNQGVEVIKEKASQVKSELILAEEVDNIKETNLKGAWQKKNLALVLKAVEILRQQGIIILETAVKKGFKNVSWPARFQYIEKFNLILDGAHNPNAAKLLRESLDTYYPDREKIWIYSSINTKNYEEVMEILFRHGDKVIFTQSNSGAAVSSEILKSKFLQKNKACKIYTTKNIQESVNIYLKLITEQSIGMSFVLQNGKAALQKELPLRIGIMTGSLYSVGDFLSQYILW